MRDFYQLPAEYEKLPIRPGEFSSLPFTSKNTANVTLFYEKGRVNLRLGAYYVSRNPWFIGGNGVPDVFLEPRLSPDFIFAEPFKSA